MEIRSLLKAHTIDRKIYTYLIEILMVRFQLHLITTLLETKSPVFNIIFNVVILLTIRVLKGGMTVYYIKEAYYYIWPYINRQSFLHEHI